MSYSLKATAHKLGPIYYSSFPSSSCLPFQAKSKIKKRFLAIFGTNHKREIKIKPSYSNNDWVNMQRL